MEQSYKVFGMTCEGCKSSVEKSLSSIENVGHVTVNLQQEEATITMRSPISIDELQATLSEKFTITAKEGKSIQSEVASEGKKSTLQQLFPLFLIFTYILATSLLLNRTSWSLNEFMFDFMGLFYVVFSFFKILDVKGFAMSFNMYDPIANKISGYGFVYPFIELTLGLLFLFRFQLQVALVLTLVVLGVTTIGVTKTLLDKKSIKCACLGSVLNLPMTKATFIENSIMIVMALYMLITSS